MSAKYCSSCGTELEQWANFCPECGTKVSDEESNTADQYTQTIDNKLENKPTSNSMFLITGVLMAGYFASLIFGFVIGINFLFVPAAGCFLLSLITMYVDLRDLETQLWETRPILWVVGALLLYIVIGPLYIYKRQQIAEL